MTIETVYVGNDNSIDIILKEDGVAVDLSGTSRVTLELDSVYDSAVVGWGDNEPFDVTEGSGKLIMRLGGLGIAAGNYPEAELVVYDPGNLNGIVWGKLKVIVE